MKIRLTKTTPAMIKASLSCLRNSAVTGQQTSFQLPPLSWVAENHYPTMSIEEICALPVSELAAKDSTLFLWATFPQLNEAFRVIDAWGFK